MKDGRHKYLRRLDAGYYRGHAYVHWSLTIDGRQTGWLSPNLHYEFRELLTHTTFRYGFCCPIYCLMPDHMHLLWVGVTAGCDQRHAMKFLRSQLNRVLKPYNASLQLQGFDHVLREEERERTAFEDVADYIVRNPERKKLVPLDGFAQYEYSGCLIPGYPDLNPFQDRYWETYWKLYSRLRRDGLTRTYEMNDDTNL